jgi:hypothetical protein
MELCSLKKRSGGRFSEGPGRDGQPWQAEAFRAHAVKPFQGILVTGPGAPAPAFDATLGLDNQPLWEVRTGAIVPRSAPALAEALRFMLEKARSVMVVDAYFDPKAPFSNPDRSKWLRPIREVAAALPRDGRLERFSIHTLNRRPPKDPWLQGTFRGHCQTGLCKALPKGVRVEALLWKERPGGREFHERIIVTDLGGVAIDPGFDEGPAGQMYTLRLLSKVELKEYFAKFDPNTSPYDIDETVEVIGAP